MCLGAQRCTLCPLVTQELAWLQEESLAFAEQYRELAEKMQRHLAPSELEGTHGCLALLGMATASIQRGLVEEVEEEEPLPLQAHLQVGLGLCSIGMILVRIMLEYL